MPAQKPTFVLVFSIAMWLAAAGSVRAGGPLSVVSMSPPARVLNAPVDSPITITFDQPVNPATIDSHSFYVFGRWTGCVAGSYTFANNNQTVSLVPQRELSAGDSIMVVLSHDILAADGSPLRPAGYSFRFWTAAAPARMEFNEIDTFDNCGNPCEQTRLYGASGTDLNDDGWLDLATVNEVSGDLRVFMNRGDGTGFYHDYLTPPEELDFESSPNEPADFNGDGKPDLCVASAAESTLSILLGNGDGTFGPRQALDVDTAPHGIAVLDVDGDGDIDIVTSNTSGNNCSLAINNGAGVFSDPVDFEGGCNGEYALGSADMNNDGIFDLVVGCRFSQNVSVLLGNGSGGFTPQPPAATAGGLVWMLSIGDVNGDGNEDVLTANSTSNNAGVLIGDGTGDLDNATLYTGLGFSTATDVGDLDGDGDLDWLVSSYGDSKWTIFENDGTGDFTVNEVLSAPANPSCSIMLDIDNDRDLDLALTDEIADVIILLKNKGPLVDGDMNCDGYIDARDITPFVQALLNPLGYRAAYVHCEIANGDVNNDLSVNVDDISAFAALLVGI